MSEQAADAVQAGATDPRLRVVVAGDAADYAMLAVQSTGGEASIRFLNANGIPWHVGSGGGPGPKGFFIWNEEAGVLLAVGGTTLTFNGTIVAQGLTLKAPEGQGAILQGIQRRSEAPPEAELETVKVDIKTGRLYYE